MHETFLLENRLRKDDLTSKCCTLPDQWIACFFGIDGSAFWVLLVEIPSSAVSAEEPGAVSVKIHVCFSRMRLLSCHAVTLLVRKVKPQ